MYFLAIFYLQMIHEKTIFAAETKTYSIMKKERLLLVTMLIVTMLSLPCVNTYASPFGIDLQVGYIDPDAGNIGNNKAPVFVPKISIEDYTVFFFTPCDGSTLRLLDENGNVVYSTIIPNGATSLVLPSSLSGSYELQIIQGNLYFYGYITL